LNSQLVGDSLDESEQFADNEVELRRVGGVYWAYVTVNLLSFTVIYYFGHDSCSYNV